MVKQNLLDFNRTTASRYGTIDRANFDGIGRHVQRVFSGYCSFFYIFILAFITTIVLFFVVSYALGWLVNSYEGISHKSIHFDDNVNSSKIKTFLLIRSSVFI